MESVEDPTTDGIPILNNASEPSEIYTTELESILNSECFQSKTFSSALHGNSAKSDDSAYKLELKQDSELTQLQGSGNLISPSQFHCENLLDITGNMLLPPGGGFQELLGYPMSCNDNVASAIESVDTKDYSSDTSLKNKSFEPFGMSNCHTNTTDDNKSETEPTKCCRGNLTNMETAVYQSPKTEQNCDTDVTSGNENNCVLSQNSTTKLLLSLPCVDGKGDSFVCDNNQKVDYNSEECAEKLDEYPVKSEDDFTNTSPISSEELSLDSGVASLDDQEQAQTNKAVSSNGASENGDETKKERKRIRSSLSKPEENCAKRKKSCVGKLVSFAGVTVFYFLRRQSFVTVPSQGGSTLGMTLNHNHVKKMSLKQHKKSVVQRRRSMEREQNRQQRISMKLKQLKQTYPSLETSQLMPMVVESEPEDESSDSSSTSEDEEEEDATDDNYFLQPIPTKKRRLLLRMSGVQKIDSEEKLLNKQTRESREVCGCDCKGVCVPQTCLCALSGIPCQVDRESFPCGCSSSGCGNMSGRVEFDAERVRNHYSRTMRRLRLEETGMASTEDDQPHMVIVEPKHSPYVSSFFEETSDGDYLQTVDQEGSSTSEESQNPSCSLSTPRTNFNHSNNGHLVFTQNPAKNWYTESTCHNFYQNPSTWGSYNTQKTSQTNSYYEKSSTSYHEQQAVLSSAQFSEPHPVNTSQPMALSNPAQPNECGYSLTENDCSASHYGTALTKSSTPAPQSVDNINANTDLPTSSFRLDPIASFFPQVDIGGKATTLYDGNFTSTNSVASNLTSCQKFCDIGYQSDMDGLSGHFQNSDSDNLSIATSVSDHGQDTVDVIA